MPRIELGAATDVGLARDTNEDAHLALGSSSSLPGALLAVADGMGGHNAGEVASALAIETLAASVQGLLASGKSARLEWVLRQAVEQANLAIWESAAADPARRGMGTTLVCALVAGSGEAAIANVGDSRAYLVRGGAAALLTADHSVVADLVRAGRLTQEEAEIHPYRNVLSRSLGVERDVQVDVYPGLRLRPGDLLVLCSDGVSTYIRLAELGPVLAEVLNAQDAAERLVELAVRRGGQDNATAVVARLVA